MNIEIELAGVSMRIALRLPETERYFRGYITRRGCDGWDVRVEDDDPARYPLICPSGILDPFSETYLLMPRASAFLLRQQRVLVHGVSFVWRGRSWLFTAPSGTGKTTQLRHWQKLYGDEIKVINGDKSVLARHEDGSLWLHPSPWMGKEKDFGAASAPLGGIVVLEQADRNEMRRLPPRESVLRIYQQFLMSSLTGEEVRAAARLESALLEHTPVWLLRNLGDEASAQLTYQILSDYEAVDHENV